MNTVPTVIRLTSKLLKSDLSGVEYPFCPLCLGLRDKTNNLLEIGSTIKHIEHGETGAKTVSIQSADEWFDTQMEKAFCFGCKRMSIEAVEKQTFL